MARAGLVPWTNPAGTSPGEGGGGPFRRILVPVGADGHSDRAVSLAASICLADSGELRIIHVRVFDPAVRGTGRFYPESSQEATMVLASATARAWACGAKASGVVIDAQRGLVARMICDACRDWKADLIVLARTPRLIITRLILGSIAEKVMRRATCPVLIVRPG
jgi:nucleotide-binding universal stress UspA family protein